MTEQKLTEEEKREDKQQKQMIRFLEERIKEENNVLERLQAEYRRLTGVRFMYFK